VELGGPGELARMIGRKGGRSIKESSEGYRGPARSLRIGRKTSDDMKRNRSLVAVGGGVTWAEIFLEGKGQFKRGFGGGATGRFRRFKGWGKPAGEEIKAEQGQPLTGGDRKGKGRGGLERPE